MGLNWADAHLCCVSPCSNGTLVQFSDFYFFFFFFGNSSKAKVYSKTTLLEFEQTEQSKLTVSLSSFLGMEENGTETGGTIPRHA